MEIVDCGLSVEEARVPREGLTDACRKTHQHPRLKEMMDSDRDELVLPLHSYFNQTN